MKQTCLLVLGLLSISGKTWAQEKSKLSDSEKTFSKPAFPIRRSFEIDLGKGNLFYFELSDIGSLKSFSNIDSLLQVFLLDMVPLRDSLNDPINSKRIDYIIDTNGSKMIRIQQFKPRGENYLLKEGTLSALKRDQDTIFISGLIRNRGPQHKKQALAYYRLSFYLNQATELPGYIDGRLNEKMKEIQANVNSRWQPLLNGAYIMRGDTSVTVKKSGGPYFRINSTIGTYICANIQNYKNYFVPSLSLGVAIRLNNGLTTHDLGLYWEPQFFFAMNQLHNMLVTYQNDFITLFYQLGYTQNHRSVIGGFHFRPFVSLGYLYQQEGGFYETHSFRLGIAKAELVNNRVTLEPVLYFHDFFREVTPGLKFVVRF